MILNAIQMCKGNSVSQKVTGSEYNNYEWNVTICSQVWFWLVAQSGIHITSPHWLVHAQLTSEEQTMLESKYKARSLGIIHNVYTESDTQCMNKDAIYRVAMAWWPLAMRTVLFTNRSISRVSHAS